MMPMAVFAATTSRKINSPKEPTAIKKPAMMKKIRLKKENKFSSTIRFTDLEGDSGGVLT